MDFIICYYQYMHNFCANANTLNMLMSLVFQRLNCPKRCNREMTARFCAEADGKIQGIMGQQGLCPIKVYRMAIGLPGEPLAPLRRSGAKLKANS